MNSIIKLFNLFKKLPTTYKIVIGVIVVAVIITIIVVPIVMSGKSKNQEQNIISTNPTINNDDKNNATFSNTTVPNITYKMPVKLGGECDTWTSVWGGITESINPHIINGRAILELAYKYEPISLPEFPDKDVYYQFDKISAVPNYNFIRYEQLNKTAYTSGKTNRMKVGDKYAANIISRILVDKQDNTKITVDRVYKYTC